MSFSLIGLHVAAGLLLINWIAGLTHRATLNHVATWRVWLWRLFWLFLLIELISNLVSDQSILRYALILIIAPILSNLSSWKSKTR